MNDIGLREFEKYLFCNVLFLMGAIEFCFKSGRRFARAGGHKLGSQILESTESVFSG